MSGDRWMHKWFVPWCYTHPKRDKDTKFYSPNNTQAESVVGESGALPEEERREAFEFTPQYPRTGPRNVAADTPPAATASMCGRRWTSRPFGGVVNLRGR